MITVLRKAKSPRGEALGIGEHFAFEPPPSFSVFNGASSGSCGTGYSKPQAAGVIPACCGFVLCTGRTMGESTG